MVETGECEDVVSRVSLCSDSTGIYSTHGRRWPARGLTPFSNMVINITTGGLGRPVSYKYTQTNSQRVYIDEGEGGKGGTRVPPLRVAPAAGVAAFADGGGRGGRARRGRRCRCRARAACASLRRLASARTIADAPFLPCFSLFSCCMNCLRPFFLGGMLPDLPSTRDHN